MKDFATVHHMMHSATLKTLTKAERVEPRKKGQRKQNAEPLLRNSGSEPRRDDATAYLRDAKFGLGRGQRRIVSVFRDAGETLAAIAATYAVSIAMISRL